MKKLQIVLLVAIFSIVSAGSAFAQEADSGVVTEPVIVKDTVEPTEEDRKSRRLFRAQLLGLSREEVKINREEGMSFEDMFEAQGLTQEDIDAAKFEYKLGKKINTIQNRLAEAVENGDMTQEQADRKWEQISERLKAKYGVEELNTIN